MTKAYGSRGLDSRRVERGGENASRSVQRIRTWMCTVEEGNELEGVITVGEHRRRLSAKLGDGALALDLGPGWSERTLGWTGALGHRALLARRMLPPKTQRGPKDGVELQEKE